MKKNLFKRILSTVLALSIVVPGGAITARAESTNPTPKSPEKVQAADRISKLAEKYRRDELDREKPEKVDPNEELRVIVEFATQPNKVSLFKSGTSSLSKIAAEQSTFFKAVSSKGIEFKKLDTFRQVFNGASAKVLRKDMETLKSLPGVVDVYVSHEYSRPEPFMTKSVGAVNAPYAWDLDYTGEGLVVGVIDSGFDTSHPDFVLSNPDKAKIKENSAVLMNLKGRYVSEKFPYAYNYYDQNNTIYESGESHGQHVAGTIGANGEIKGVAPEAQLLALRVFSNDPLLSTTFDDIYIKAMEDGVMLGADAFNLSLGAANGFTTWTESALDKAVVNARNSGVVVAIAAGNDRNMTEGTGRTAASWIPDQGLMSTPAVTRESFVVAATDKTPQKWEETFAEYTSTAGAQKKTILPAELSPHPVDVFGDTEMDFAIAGYGSPAEYASANVAGKVAVVSRGGGTPNFIDKLANAQAAGAVALIIYNHSDGDLISMAGGENATIPYLFADKATGADLVALAAKKIKFSATPVETPTIQMASFSTWGPTNDLRLKPEISAPGQSINSTQNDGTYGLMSGTSMATPHVAGGSAVVKGYINSSEAFKDLSKLDKSSLTKNLMMNSAKVLFFGGAARSPRVQGAGLMDLENAVETRTLAYHPTTKEAKIELKEVPNKAFDLNLTVENFGQDELSYTSKVYVITDDIEDGSYTELSREVKATVTGTKEFSLAGGAKKAVNLHVDFSEDAIETEQFIEGFVVMTDNNGRTTTVPFMGFYGDWNKPQILDNFYPYPAEDPDGPSFFESSALFGYSEVQDDYFLHKNNRIELNPGTFASTLLGTGDVSPQLSFLRNAEKFSFSILDENKAPIFKIGSTTFVNKVALLYRPGFVPYTNLAEGEWNGKLQDGYIPEGKYFYEMRGTINYEKAVDQVKLVPILVDYSAPVVKNVKLEGDTLTFEATDGPEDRGVGVAQFIVSNSQTDNSKDIEVEKTDDNKYSVDVAALRGDEVFELYIYAYDNLLNEGVTTVKIQDYPQEEYSPFMLWLEPTEISETTDVHVTAYVLDVQYMDTIQLITESKTYDQVGEFVENGPVPNPNDPEAPPIYVGPHWKIDTTIQMDPGFRSLKLLVRAKDGTEDSLIRWIYVDNGAPELDVQVQDRDAASDKAVLDVTMSDELPFLRLKLNNEEIFTYDGFNQKIEKVTKTMSHEVALKVGVNTFNFVVEDALGHKTEKTVEVVREEKVENAVRIEGDTRYLTSIEVSKKAFDRADWVILVSGESATDSLLAGPLSIRLQAPVLLTGKAGLTNALTAEIKRLGATNAMIIGGDLVVSQATEEAVKALGLDVERLGGATRYETSVKVDRKVRDISRVTDKAVIANGSTVFDALTMGAAAGKMGVGILLNDGKSNAMIEASLEGVKSAILLGGTKVETTAAEDDLKAKGITVERVAGATRYATAVAIANKFYADPTSVIVTNGLKPYDALSAAGLSNKYNAPLLITPADELNAETKAYIESVNPNKAYVLGGNLAITEAVRAEIELLLN